MKENHYNVLIVDDLKIHREYLFNKLNAEFPFFSNVYQAESVNFAISFLEDNLIDLVFLDVEMPEKNGFEFVKEIIEIGVSLEIIFVTAYDRYAIQALRNNALDFILKPIDHNELKNAIDRFVSKMEHEPNLNSDKFQALLNSLNVNETVCRIGLPTLHGFVFIDEQDILQCEADNTYTTFHLLNNTKIIVSKTLKDCEEILSKNFFFRVHHSHLVNINLIKEYVRGEGGHITLYNDQIIPVSRSKKHAFLSRIKRI
jgi:two-component system LytT family response regulator